LTPANRLPNSFIIGKSLSAVRSIIEIDSSRILGGISFTGEFSFIKSLLNYFSFNWLLVYLFPSSLLV